MRVISLGARRAWEWFYGHHVFCVHVRLTRIVPIRPRILFGCCGCSVRFDRRSNFMQRSALAVVERWSPGKETL